MLEASFIYFDNSQKFKALETNKILQELHLKVKKNVFLTPENSFFDMFENVRNSCDTLKKLVLKSETSNFIFVVARMPGMKL